MSFELRIPKTQIYPISEFIKKVNESQLVTYKKIVSPPIETSYVSPQKAKQSTASTDQKYGLLSTTGRAIVDSAFTEDFFHDIVDYNHYRKKYKDLISDLLEDTRIALDINASEHDPDYVQNYGNIGKFVEIYCSLYFNCPVCNKNTLRLFKSDSMPVVDLKCINVEHDHTKGPSLWQVKATIGDDYFDKTKKLISVGSRKWGQNVHLEPTSQYEIGYICIRIDQQIEENIFYINKTKSFIVNPIQDDFKYSYLTVNGPWGHSLITWEGITEDLPLLETTKINFDELLSYTPITIDFLGGMHLGGMHLENENNEPNKKIGGYYKITYSV